MTSGWTVEILNETVFRELDALPADIRARFTRIVELIEMVGLENVGMPYVRHLDGKLWEIRMKGRDGIARAIYVTCRHRRIVILHAFRKKSEKTPKSAIRLALTRMKDIRS